MKAECPICHGSGEFELPAQIKIDSVEIKRRIAIELREKGYSIRQIQVSLGYKSPLSVQLFLKK